MGCMYLKLKEMLSEYSLKLIYMEMEEPGFYYPKPRIVFLNENYTKTVLKLFI